MLNSVTTTTDRDLLEACRATLRGEPFLYPGAVTALIRDYLHRARQGESVPDTILTPREEEVLKLVAEGYSSREIGNTLGISVKTSTGTGPTPWPSSGCGTVWR